MGYLEDDRVDAFAPSTSTGDDGRHPPLVHRGYWARTAAVRALTNAFASSVDARETFNVVNVGCGYDTIGLYVLDRHANAHPRLSTLRIICLPNASSGSIGS